jgi:hypothetical protein
MAGLHVYWRNGFWLKSWEQGPGTCRASGYIISITGNITSNLRALGLEYEELDYGKAGAFCKDADFGLGQNL